MAKARLVTSIEDYILEEDRELKPEEQTVFKLKYLTAVQAAELQDTFTTNKNYAMQMLEAVKLALAGWDNLVDENDKTVAFKSAKKVDNAMEQNINRLSPSWITELGGQVLKQTFPDLVEEESGDLKN